MDAEWIKSPTARRILMHWGDPRPAWLWSHDGTTLLWRNPTARYFYGRIKKSGLKLAPEAVPIKGQIARLIRLGAEGRSSLSRIQFLAGDRPVSTTCSCTPLALPDGEVAMLLVGVDPIDPELLDAPQEFVRDRMAEALFPAGADYLLIDDGQVRGGSPHALSAYAQDIEEHGLNGLPEGGDGTMTFGGEVVHVTRLRASSQDAVLLMFSGGTNAGRIAEIRAEEGLEAERANDTAEPMLPMGLPPLEPSDERSAQPLQEPMLVPPSSDRSLTSLFDRLADDAGLYTSLTAADEIFTGAPPDANAAEAPPETLLPVNATMSDVAEGAAETIEAPVEEPAPDYEHGLVGDIIEYADDPEADEPDAGDNATEISQWQIAGRGFYAYEADEPTDPPAEPIVPPDVAVPPADSDKVSRYNFEELGRILTDRVAGEAPVEIDPPIPPLPAPPQQLRPARVAGPDAVINLNAETLVLNRLPLGILLFRDQQVLFANRALVELLGHESVEQLRAAGIAAIFPATSVSEAGPVTQLLRRDGTMLPVGARLQSVTWQGKPALMLSAAVAEQRTGHEGAVRAFAEIAADARGEGFVQTDRNGVVTLVSAHGRVLLGATETDLTGRPLTALIAASEIDALRKFLDRPARFAETARPSLLTHTVEPGVDLVVFAEGQAGIVTGYFGMLRKTTAAAPVAKVTEDELEPSMLARLSRGIRRPLNTIVGFADLIRSSAFGAIENQRYVEYARDIKTAGSEIAALVDELDDFARLKDGRYAPRPSDVDLAALLESCMIRVKGQAGNARVLVRSAISEQLPRIRADRASLGQAVLNLLASAIDQTPVGGSVILSAQWQDDGGIAVHVRDGAQLAADMGERFVVFRDGVGRDGEVLAPVRSSVGLALTRSLLAVNACSLSVDPTAGTGTLFSLVIPAELIVRT
ncbi:MAG: HAMP domain-containing sensor histidine kinase [Devosia sp.]